MGALVTPGDELRARLRTAAADGEIVRVVYLRGSQPGSVREIAPVALYDTEVLARDIAAGLDKVFTLAHLALVDPDTTITYDPAAPLTPTLAVEAAPTVAAALRSGVEELQGLGWHVELSEHQASLHRFFKNGTPRKGHDVILCFEEFTMDSFDNGDGLGLQHVTRPSMRPYYVSSPSLGARTFLRLSSALPAFWAEARKHAPRRA